MFGFIRKGFCSSCIPFGTGPKCEECTDFEHIGVSRQLGLWAKKNAQVTTPEEIIVAAVIQSFAKDFDKWQSHHFDDPQKAWKHTNYPCRAYYPEKEITITRRVARKGSDDNYKYRFTAMSINDIDIPPHLAKEVDKAWNTMAVQLKQTQEAANRAKADMERNEKAWNLAENLLGMKRNEHGALVPKEIVE